MFGLISLIIVIFIGVWVVWGFGNSNPTVEQAKTETYQQAIDLANDAARQFEETQSSQ